MKAKVTTTTTVKIDKEFLAKLFNKPISRLSHMTYDDANRNHILFSWDEISEIDIHEFKEEKSDEWALRNGK